MEARHGISMTPAQVLGQVVRISNALHRVEVHPGEHRLLLAQQLLNALCRNIGKVITLAIFIEALPRLHLCAELYT